MAGIGFRLRRLTEQESLAEVLRGYFSAGVVCCGPWILTVLTLSLADLLMLSTGQARGPNLFRLLIVYAYALSLISTGGLAMIVTRYLADRLYAEDPERHLPTLVGVGLLNCPLQALLAAGFVLPLPIGVPFKVAFVTLFVLVASLWLLMAFLGAIRAYTSVVRAFLAGSLASLVAMLALKGFGELGYLLGFVAGQGVILLLMTQVLFREFELQRGPDFGFLGYLSRHPWLFAAGTLLNLGVWVGVFSYWLSPVATIHHGLPSYYPHHDVAVFLGLLSILPAMVLFFVKTETEFYEGYRAFFGGITTSKVPLAELRRRKAEMTESLTRGLGDLVKVQGVVTLILLTFTADLLGPLELPAPTLAMTRNCLVGAFLLVLFQCVATILLYYEAYREVAGAGLALTLGNLGGAQASLALGPSTHGLGLALGSALGLVLAGYFLQGILRHLERVTFMRQPMPGQVRLTRISSEGSPFADTLMKDGRWL